MVKSEVEALETVVVRLLLPLVERSSPLSCRSVNSVNCPSLVGLFRIRQEVGEEQL